jgi:hypothetical protein
MRFTRAPQTASIDRGDVRPSGGIVPPPSPHTASALQTIECPFESYRNWALALVRTAPAFSAALARQLTSDDLYRQSAMSVAPENPCVPLSFPSTHEYDGGVVLRAIPMEPFPHHRGVPQGSGEVLLRRSVLTLLIPGGRI